MPRLPEVRGNTIAESALGKGSPGFHYGIEAGGDHSIIISNSIRGFQVGIVVQGASTFASVTNNHLTDQTSGGVMFSNAGAELGTKVQGIPSRIRRFTGYEMILQTGQGAALRTIASADPADVGQVTDPRFLTGSRQALGFAGRADYLQQGT